MTTTQLRAPSVGAFTRHGVARSRALRWLSLRGRGLSASRAGDIMRRDDIAARVLHPIDAHGDTFAAWRVDAPALYLTTVSERDDAFTGYAYTAAGERILSPLSLPLDVSAVVEIERDDDASIDDAECYSPDDIDAWRRDAWEYVIVTATVTHADGRTSSESIGGVELGDYWPGSDAGQVWHVVPDLIREALASLV